MLSYEFGKYHTVNNIMLNTEYSINLFINILERISLCMLQMVRNFIAGIETIYMQTDHLLDKIYLLCELLFL